MEKEKNKEALQRIVGENIRRIRCDNHMSQEELSEALGLSKNFISLLETGSKFPSAETISKLASVFDCDYCVFFFDASSSADKIIKDVRNLISFAIDEEIKNKLPLKETRKEKTKRQER